MSVDLYFSHRFSDFLGPKPCGGMQNLPYNYFPLLIFLKVALSRKVVFDLVPQSSFKANKACKRVFSRR